jgi:hypothetical protein
MCCFGAKQREPTNIPLEANNTYLAERVAQKRNQASDEQNIGQANEYELRERSANFQFKHFELTNHDWRSEVWADFLCNI